MVTCDNVQFHAQIMTPFDEVLIHILECDEVDILTSIRQVSQMKNSSDPVINQIREEYLFMELDNMICDCGVVVSCAPMSVSDYGYLHLRKFLCVSYVLIALSASSRMSTSVL
jgi:hypothetical protein